jgi:hypothetical protein
MRTISITALAGTMLILAGCDSAEPAKEAKAETPATIAPGEYSYTSEVTKLVSTDKSTPSTKLKQGDKEEGKTCVGADGVIDQALLVEAGDKCTATGTYARSGRVSNQYQCSRAGKGSLYPNADGNFTADGFEILANSSSQFSGDGDYPVTRHIVAKRTGACTAAPAKA